MRSVLLLQFLLAVGYCTSNSSDNQSTLAVNQTNITSTDNPIVTTNTSKSADLLSTVPSSPVTCNEPKSQDCHPDQKLWANCNNDCNHLGMQPCSQCFAPNCTCNATAGYLLMVSKDNQCMYQRSCPAMPPKPTPAPVVCEKNETLLAAVACWIVSILLIVLLIHCRTKYVKDKAEMVELVKVMDNIKHIEETSEVSEVSTVSTRLPPRPAGTLQAGPSVVKLKPTSTAKPEAGAKPGDAAKPGTAPQTGGQPDDGLGSDASAVSAKSEASLSFDESNQLKMVTKKMKKLEKEAKKERKRRKKKRKRMKSKAKSLRAKKKKDKAAAGTFASEVKEIDPSEQSIADFNLPPQPQATPQQPAPPQENKVKSPAAKSPPKNEPQPPVELPTPAPPKP